MKYKYIYGPVPSRRLGISLGIDPIPLKVCSFNCIYCEVARTTLLTTERKEYIPSEKILLELKNFLKESNQHIDYITFSGSGEPTLNSKIGYMIKKIKKFANIPVAVLTNASLLYREDVRDELLNADLVKCTLDAAEEKYFKRINQPEQSLTIQRIINGIIKFSETYKGKLLIEVMLVRDVNDTEENYRALHKVLKKIKADKVQINTVVRPSAVGFARPLTDQELKFARKIIESNAEIIKPLDRKTNKAYRADLEEAIIDSIAIRPQTIDDLAKGLGAHRDEILKYIELLTGEEKIIEIDLRGEKFYKATSKLSE
ncbi:MAG: radical SAM protein [Caldisericaceae bacterium]|nr:radical SAM protein [Caldisericaceae bacterium]